MRLPSTNELTSVKEDERLRVTSNPDAWEALIDCHFSPYKVAIIEAMLWIDQPLSAVEFHHIFEKKAPLSTISYHIRTLAKLGALDLVREEKVRGRWKKTYYLHRGRPNADR